MNRPNGNDYVTSKYLGLRLLHKAYRNAMEDYCDELEKKQEKYKWHDLRKDSNDLPINLLGKTVLVCQKSSWGTNYYNLCYHDKKGFNYYDSEYGDIVLDNVIAWKYIEEFEGE